MLLMLMMLVLWPHLRLQAALLSLLMLMMLVVWAALEAASSAADAGDAHDAVFLAALERC